MARSRNLKPGFVQNEALADCGPLAHLLFAALWIHADKEGRLEDRPRRLKIQCLPYYDCDVNELLDALASAQEPFIVRYEVDGRAFIQVVNWHKHQTPHHMEAESVIPPCPNPLPVIDSTTDRDRLDDDESTPRAPIELKESGIRNQESEKRESVKEGGCKGGTRRKPFVPPTLQEVADYFRERDNKLDPESFWAHYDANGWVQGSKSKPVVSWKSCVITWEKNAQQFARGSPGRTAGDPRGNLALRERMLAETRGKPDAQ